MKNNNIFLSMLAIMMAVTLSFTFASCGGDDDPSPTTQTPPATPTLKVSDSSIQLEADGSSTNVTVTAENTDWSPSANASWLHATKSGGNMVTISADKNPDTKERSGTVIITPTATTLQPQTISVTQKGLNAYIRVNGVSSTSLSTFPGLFTTGKSGIDYKETISVTSNVEWAISNVPDWLSVSPTSGKETVTMTIYPKSENLTAEDRSATITLTGNDQTATIKVSQKRGLSDAKVIPANLATLHNQIGWELEASGSVDKYRLIMVTEAVYNRKTDKELMADLEYDETSKFSDNAVFFYAKDSYGNAITSSTTYYICTIAYNQNDEPGELVKTKVTTPAYIDYNNDAFVSFSEAYYNSSSFQFTVTKEGFCDTYHLIYGNLPLTFANYNSVLYAFEINYFIKNKKKHWLASQYNLEIVTNYPNNHTFTHYTSTLASRPFVIAYGQGVFKDGKLSSDLTGVSGDTSSSRQLARAKKADTTPSNMVLTPAMCKAE